MKKDMYNIETESDVLDIVEVDESEIDEVEADVLDVLEEVKEEERKERRKRAKIYNTVRRMILLVMLGVFCYSVYSLAVIYLDYQKSNNTYEDISNMFYKQVNDRTDSEDEPETNEEGVTIKTGSISGTHQEWVWDYDALLGINGDAVGWISLPGTIINYPILQGRDNDQYLHTTITGQSAIAGSIFVDYRNTLGLDGNYCIVYGHNMNNGSMFGSLKKMRDREYQEAHPYFDVYIKEKHYRYYTYSLYIVEPYETADSPYQFQYEVLNTDEKKQQYEDFIAQTISKSMFKVKSCPIEITADSKVMTLSTCSGSGTNKKRMIVHLVRGEEVIDS